MSKIKTYTVTSVKSNRTVAGTGAAFLAALADDAEFRPAYGVDVSDADGNTVFSTHDLTDRLLNLQSEAAEVGDVAQADLCATALAGDNDAVLACVQTLADAAAQID